MCGITTAEDARAALSAGADALGFNFYPKSARYIAPDAAGEIISELPKGPWYVGVFVNESRSEAAEIAARSGITTLQFHGDEDSAYFKDWDLPTIRALRLAEGRYSSEDITNALDTADYLLFDRYEEQEYGGSGKEISSSSVLGSLGEDVWSRSFLAGGLTPDTVGARVERYQPFGVDVASGIEDGVAGRKSEKKMKDFVSAVRG